MAAIIENPCFIRILLKAKACIQIEKMSPKVEIRKPTQRKDKQVSTESHQKQIKGETRQTAAEARQDLIKGTFSLDVFSRFEGTSAAECYVLVSEKGYNNKWRALASHETAAEGRPFFSETALPPQRFARDAVTGQQQ